VEAFDQDIAVFANADIYGRRLPVFQNVFGQRFNLGSIQSFALGGRDINFLNGDIYNSHSLSLRYFLTRAKHKIYSIVMRNYCTQPPPIISLPVTGSDDRFPVRRIYCVGRNYADHVREMGGDPNRSTPIFFTKSRETIVGSGATIPYPPLTENLHFEVELVVAIAGNKDGATEVFGYGVGLDMTRRDMQAVAKKGGKPWDMAKNFDESAPCSAIMRASDTPDISAAAIALTNNGVVKQNSTLNKMIWSVDEIIAHLNNTVTLAAGDLIYTGTPEGVGPVVAGETLVGTIEGLPSIEVTYA